MLRILVLLYNAVLSERCVITSGVNGYSAGVNKPKFNYPYDVTLNRQHHEGFGFVLVSSSSKSGATIGLCSTPAVN